VSRFSISTAWDETRGVFARDGKLISSVALALILLPQTVSGLIAPPASLSGANPPGWMPLVALAVALLGLIGQIAIARLALGPSTSVGEAISHGARRVLPAFAALLLFGMTLALVLLPLMFLIAGGTELRSLMASDPSPRAVQALMVAVVVGFLVAPRFQLVVPTSAAERGGPIRLLQRSWALTNGSYFKLLGFLLLLFILAIVLVLFVGQMMAGILAKALFGTVTPLSVGALIAALVTAIAATAFSVMVSVMLARIYLQLAGRGEAETGVPRSGT
jgi:hypothetical protein